MRATIGLVLGTGLACSGLPAPTAPPPTPPVASPAPPADPDPTVTVMTLGPTDAGCALVATVIPGDQRHPLATIDGPCPDRWSLAVTTHGDRAVLYTADHLWRIDHDGVTALPAPPDPVDSAGFVDGKVLTCGDPADAVEADDIDHERVTFTLAGKTYEVDIDSEHQAASLLRQEVLEGTAWKVRSVAALSMGEGVAATPPICDSLDDWPEGFAIGSPNHLLDDEGEWTPPEGALLAALTAIDPGQWSVAPGGRLAARTDELGDGLTFETPVARVVDGVRAEPIPELAKSAGYDVRGKWLLVDTDPGAILLDTATGSIAWRSPIPAGFWPEGAAVLPAAR